MANSLATISTAELNRILSVRMEIEDLNAELSRLVGGSDITPKTRKLSKARPAKRSSVAKVQRRKMSSATRARMVAAANARWAKRKGESLEAAPKVVVGRKKAKRRMSAEGRARIGAAAKARWAKLRAETQGPTA